ncbi:LacI family DNA-binding transcriptional regulator [Bradyrhizobium jicamae]|uniref:LacI family DNA-binding transcriptional regulator n=1 Tax=Bradyrhizobium jicamae TaxID=280332 RepID=UPI0018DD1B50|nr:LacI family DNA-binding transcriptional regulator [Bradyrhizobium jicamae]
MAEIAKAAGVSVATVDRVLNGRASVSSKRMELVYGAARALNYHGLPTLRSRLPVKQPIVRIGVALRRRHHAFYMAIESALRSAATRCSDAEVDLKIVCQSNNTAQEAASLIQKLAESCHVIALMAPDHSAVSDAVKVAREKNVFTFSLLSDFAIDARQAYLGVDNRKAGRTAAWGASHTAQRPGALAIVVGSHGYLAQEMREAGFRSYIRERQPEFTVVDTLVSAESEDDVRHGVERLLGKREDIVGIYVASGGVEGALEALRRKARTGKVALICNELTPLSREAVAERAATMIIATPVEQLTQQLVTEAVHTVNGRGEELSKPGPIPFELYVSENI